MGEISYPIPRALLLTSNQRQHWAPKAKATRELRRIAYWQGRAHLDQRVTSYPVRCVVTIDYRDRRRRDAANLAPTIKAILDGLVDAGILPDDSTEYLTGADPRIGYDATLRAGFLGVTVRFTRED